MELYLGTGHPSQWMWSNLQNCSPVPFKKDRLLDLTRCRKSYLGAADEDLSSVNLLGDADISQIGGLSLPILVLRGALEMPAELSGPDSRRKILRKCEPCWPSGRAGVSTLDPTFHLPTPTTGCLSQASKATE